MSVVRIWSLFQCKLCSTQVSAALAGRSVQQDHWKDSILRKQENSSHSANKTSLIVRKPTAIMAAKEGWWIMLSDTSKPTAESIPRLLTRMRERTITADFKLATLELPILVRHRYRYDNSQHWIHLWWSFLGYILLTCTFYQAVIFEEKLDADHYYHYNFRTFNILRRFQLKTNNPLYCHSFQR